MDRRWYEWRREFLIKPSRIVFGYCKVVMIKNEIHLFASEVITQEGESIAVKFIANPPLVFLPDAVGLTDKVMIKISSVSPRHPVVIEIVVIVRDSADFQPEDRIWIAVITCNPVELFVTGHYYPIFKMRMIVLRERNLIGYPLSGIDCSIERTRLRYSRNDLPNSLVAFRRIEY